MKELHEFRIFEHFYHLLQQPNDAKFNGLMYVINVNRDDPLFNQIGKIDRELRFNNRALFSSWSVRRIYSKKEFADAELFHVNINRAFEPTGEECGTEYDENAECEICGANRKQRGPLMLKKGSIPKKDISRTIAGEVVVSEKFANAVKKHRLKGVLFKPVFVNKAMSSHYFQLDSSSPSLDLSDRTIAGIHPFDLSTETTGEQEFTVSGGYKIRFEKIVLKCPKGHLIGDRLISEPFVKDTFSINQYDFFVTKQKIGAKLGLLQPEPLYLCSPAFRTMVLDEKMTGFDFEIAHIGY